MATTKELHKLIANAGMAPPRSAPIADKVMALAEASRDLMCGEHLSAVANAPETVLVLGATTDLSDAATLGDLGKCGRDHSCQH